MKHARLENGIVRELIDFDPAGRFHPSLIWVQCPDATAIGDVHDAGAFAAPPPPVLPPEVVAAMQKSAADAAHAQEARQYAKLAALREMSPAQVGAWVDANVTNLATAKDAIRTLAIAVGILARRL